MQWLWPNDFHLCMGLGPQLICSLQMFLARNGRLQEQSVVMMDRAILLISHYATSSQPRMQLTSRTSLSEFRAGPQFPKDYALTFLSCFSHSNFPTPRPITSSLFLLSCWQSPHDDKIFHTCLGLIDSRVKVAIWVYSTVLAYQIIYQQWDTAF